MVRVKGDVLGLALLLIAFIAWVFVAISTTVLGSIENAHASINIVVYGSKANTYELPIEFIGFYSGGKAYLPGVKLSLPSGYAISIDNAVAGRGEGGIDVVLGPTYAKASAKVPGKLYYVDGIVNAISRLLQEPAETTVTVWISLLGYRLEKTFKTELDLYSAIERLRSKVNTSNIVFEVSYTDDILSIKTTIYNVSIGRIEAGNEGLLIPLKAKLNITTTLTHHLSSLSPPSESPKVNLILDLSLVTLVDNTEIPLAKPLDRVRLELELENATKTIGIKLFTPYETLAKHVITVLHSLTERNWYNATIALKAKATIQVFDESITRQELLPILNISIPAKYTKTLWLRIGSHTIPVNVTIEVK